MTPRPERPSVAEIFEQHSSFVWANLHRMGIRRADLPDLLQDVFMVVHQRLHTYDPAAKVTSWLYGICLRIAASHRRRAYVRREELVADAPESSPLRHTPEDAACTRQKLERLRILLDTLDAPKRAVFVMYEIEEMPCAQIAQHLGVPLGTVHSRLHNARVAFRKSVARMESRARLGAA